MCYGVWSRITVLLSTESKVKRKKPLFDENTSNNPNDPQILLAIELTTRNGSF
jgi:hypothetical protein